MSCRGKLLIVFEPSATDAPFDVDAAYGRAMDIEFWVDPI